MKKIYQVVTIVTVFILFFSLFFALRIGLEQSVPNVQSTVSVSSWDKKFSMQTVNKKIKEYALQHEIDLYKVVHKVEEGKSIKEFFVFSKQNTPKEFQDKNYKDSRQLRMESLLGQYDLATPPPNDIGMFFHSLGLTAKVERVTLPTLFLYVFEGMKSISFLLGICLILYVLSAFYYKVSQSKNYALHQLFGKSLLVAIGKEIIFPLVIVGIGFTISALTTSMYLHWLIEYSLLLSSFFILIEVLSSLTAILSTSLTEKIKGRRNYRLLYHGSNVVKVVVVAFIVLITTQAMQSMNESKALISGMKRWEKISNYYAIQISDSTNIAPDENDIGLSQVEERTKPLFTKKTMESAVLCQTNIDSIGENESASYFAKHPLMTVNQNYLKQVPIYSSLNKRMIFNKDEVVCILPENSRNHQAKILDEIRWEVSSWTKKEVKESKFIGKINILYDKNEQDLFIFNSKSPEKSKLRNAVLLVLPPKMMNEGTFNHVAAMSTSELLFKNPERMQEIISKNNLEQEFLGIVCVNSEVMNLLKQKEKDLYASIFLLIFLMVVFLFTIGLSCQLYLKMKEKQLFLEMIFGKTFLQRYTRMFVLMSLVTICTVSALQFIQETSMKIGSVLLVVEWITILTSVGILEKNAHLSILKQEQ